MKKESKTYWSDVKKKVLNLSSEGAIKLISELYALSPQNRDFLDARFIYNDEVQRRYRSKIQEYIAPKEPWKRGVQVSQAKKVLSLYKKATKDDIGLLDLMISYAEYGADFSAEYGLSAEEDEPYQCAIGSVFEEAGEMIQALRLEKEHPLFEKWVIVFKKMIKAYILDESDLEEFFRKSRNAS
jgi:hypothetical protein